MQQVLALDGVNITQQPGQPVAGGVCVSRSIVG
jgi:hypothetical protein